jgi:phosphoglycolate phosphatase
MLVVFDLDGTLIDSERDLADSTNDVIVGYGAQALPVEAVAAMVGEGTRTLVQRALAARGLDAPIDQALDRFRQAYDRRLTAHTRPYAGIVEAVADLSGRARLAVLTNKPEAPARRLLEAFDLLAGVSWVIGGDGAFPRKPDPSGLEHLMREAVVPAASTVLVGDSRIDVETARRAGAGLCLARYGFGSRRGGIEIAAGDLVVDDPRDLARVVGGFLRDRSRA